MPSALCQLYSSSTEVRHQHTLTPPEYRILEPRRTLLIWKREILKLVKSTIKIFCSEVEVILNVGRNECLKATVPNITLY